ncbi:hypothetical protein POV27_07845 [Aureisphaera galaxeae]|uniref:hypothetical protein n=1 Tax=Aureisphaera galaxeae TaxID=1538023 RepID=UPI00234FCA1E|nr:hypothetical protein [Aureisphaera galaxeae]MDC8003961.1 hypothetical protein [Aureisphaera galaxeae]
MKYFISFLFLLLLVSCKPKHVEIKLSAFETSECKKEYNFDLQGTAKSTVLNSGNYQVSVFGVANCCSDFEPVFEIKNDTLHLGFKEGGNICSCFCCYDFIYEVEGIEDISNYTIHYTNPIIEIVETEVIPEID